MHFDKTRLKQLLSWMVVDAAVMVGAYAAAFFARTIVTPQEFVQSLGFITFSIIVTEIIFYMLGLYHRIWRYTSGHEVSRLIGGVALATMLVGFVDVVFFPVRPLPLSVVVLGNALALSGFVALRFKSRVVSGLRWRWQVIWSEDPPSKQPTTRVLVVGAGDTGQQFVMRMKYRWPNAAGGKNKLYQIVGFVDDDPSKRGMYVEGVRVLGNRADIPRLVETRSIDLIVLAVHNISGPAFREILAYCESTKAQIRVVPNAYASVHNIRNTPPLREVQAEDLLGRKPVGKHDAVDFAPVEGKTILVTGAAGSIGAELCRQLLDYAPVQLVALDNNETGLYDLMVELNARALEANVRLVPVLADVTQPDALRPVFESLRPQVVFHAAAYKHVPLLELYPHEAVRVNVQGTYHTAALARDFGVERFVLISTDKAVDPSSVMGASKRLCEYLMHAFARTNGQNTLFTSVRFGNVLGSRGSVVPLFKRQIEQGGPITITHPEMKRFFMTIPEAVNLVIHAACLTTGDDLFMLQMGEEVSILELAERMIRMHGLRPHEDIRINYIGMRPGEKLNEALHVESELLRATIHPHIMQLITPLENFQAERLLSRVPTFHLQCNENGSFVAEAHVESQAAGPVFVAASHKCLACVTSVVDEAFSQNGQEVQPSHNYRNNGQSREHDVSLNL